MDEKQIEIAARKYCELRGLNPDETVSHGADPDDTGFVFDIVCYSPRWKRIAREVAPFAAMMKAIQFAKEPRP